MAKQLNVDLRFNADVQAAKRSINQLAVELEKLAKPHKIEGISSESLKAASKAAQELQGHLQNAVNVNTGKLDLSKFSQSLSRSNTDIQSLALNLSRAGSQGQQAFASLVRNINMADKSMVGLGAKMNDFATTLKNTARWQISSSILHGFMGTISSALGYAERLNTSLNNIRIVTGQSVDQMAAFAEKANAAAKALSTTTTAYTDAALIYYQQGLTGKAVEERAEVTLKLANVSRQSAETVSQQMTGIWNNFYDGSESLEHYADVLTKLGATTASSTQEIATGLEKFAAVADTVGLSYEHAAAALATITATTRQSADIVGTALKTLFARIQDLEVGKTLDDGTTLGKYSQALAAIGVQIKDANGEVRAMDDILDDMGSKWGTLSKDMQIAVAQTVAGTRQYTQLLALMDNWDFMQQNLATARGAEGELQKQADIYAESWEAAQKRVRASAESIFSDLLNDKFFIGANNALSGMLNLIDNVIDGMGGLKTIVLGLGSIFLAKFAKEIPAALQSVRANIDVITGEAAKNQQRMYKSIESVGQQMQRSPSAEAAAQGRTMELTSQMAQKLQANLSSLSKAEQAEAQNKIKQVQAAGDYAAALGREIDLLQQENNLIANRSFNTRQGEDYLAQKEAQATEVYAAQRDVTRAKMYQSNVGQISGIHSDEYKAATAEVEKMEAALRKAYEAFREVAAAPEAFQKQVANFANAAEELSRLETLAKNAKNGFDELKNSIAQTEESAATGERSNKAIAEDYKAQAESIQVFIEQLQQASGAETSFTEKTNAIIEALSKFSGTEANAAEILRNTIDEVLALTESETDAKAAIDAVTESFLAQRKALSGNMDQTDMAKIEANARQQGQLKAQQQMATPNIDFKKFAEHTKATSEAVSKFASQLMNLSMAINAVKQLGSIWSNEDLTTGEKITQSLSSISILLMSVAPMIKALDVSLLGEAAAAKVAAGATLTFKETLVGLATGPLAIILLIAAAVALIGTAVHDAAKQIHEASPEGQLEKAEQESQALTEALEDAKSAADALASAFDAYNEVQNKLAGCVEGTREWVAALQEANAATATLLQDYPELLDYVKTDSNGHTYVTQEGMDIATQRRQDAVTAATIADTSGKQRVKDAQLVVDNQDLAKKMAGGDADLREFIAHHMDEVAKIVANTDAKQVENQLNDLFKHETGGRWGRVTADQINTAVKQQGLQDELSQRVQASHLNDELAQTTNRLNAQSALANNQDIQNSKFKDDITNAIAQGMDQVQKEAAQERRKEFDKDAAREYLSNIKGVNLDNVSDLKIKGDSITYHDNEEDKDITVNKEVAIQGLAAADALANVATSASDLKGVFEHLDKLSRADVEGARGAAAMLANGNLESLNQRDAAQVFSDLGKSKQTPEHYLENIFGGADELTAAAEAAGYESGTDFAKAFLDEVQSVNNAWSKIKIPEELQDGNLLGLGAAKQLQETFDMIKTNVGSNGAASFINEINQALQGLDAEEKAEALNRIASIDFTSSDAMSQMASIILELGGNLDTTSMAWQHFIDMMQQAGNCKPSFQDVINDLINLRSALKDVDFGSVVDADTMAQIAQLSPALQDAFIQTEDGYAFLGDQKQLQDAMTEGLMRQAAAYQEAGNRAEEYKEKLADSGLSNIFRDSLADEESQKYVFGGFDTTGDAKLKAIEMMQGVEGGSQIMQDALGSETMQNLQEVLSTAEGIDSVYSRINEHLQQGSELLLDQQEKLASQATTVEQLNMLSSMGVGDDVYAKQAGLLIGTAEDSSQALSFLNDLTIGLENLPVGTIEALGEKFHNARDEALALKEAMANGADADTLAELGDDLQNAISGANLADKYGMDASVVEDMVDSYEELYDSISDGSVLLENNANSAQDAAERYIRLNQAVDDLVDNSDDYVDLLGEIAKSNKLAAGAARDSSKSMITASDGYKKFKTTLADLLDTSEDFVDMDLMEKLDPKDIVAAANGSEEAIGRIRDAFIDLQGEALDVDLSPLKEQLASMQDGEAMDLTFTVDGDTEPLMQKLLDAAVQSGMTAAEIEDMFAGMGIDCDVTPLEGSLTEAQQAAVDAGDAIVSNLGIEATDTSEEVQHEETEEMTGQTVVTTPTPANFTAGAASINYTTSAVDTGEDGPKVMNATANITPVHAFIAGQTVPSVHVTPETETVTSEKTTVAPGMMVSNAKKSAGGKVNKGGGGRGGGGRRGGGGGRRCFVAGTLVSLIKGYKPIEQLKVGDTVLSYNEKCKKNEYSQVLQVMIHDTIELFYTVYIDDETITATGTHPFYIIHNGIGDWIELQNVSIGDYVLYADGTIHEITDIDIDIKAKRVYNLEVSGNHNYYVGINQILVHNKGGGRRRGGGGRAARAMTSAQKATTTTNDIERYHEVSKSLDSVQYRYSQLSKSRNRVFGSQYAKNLEKENKLLIEQLRIVKRYQLENRDWVNRDKDILVRGRQVQWTEKDVKGNENLRIAQRGGLAALAQYGNGAFINDNGKTINIKDIYKKFGNVDLSFTNEGLLTDAALKQINNMTEAQSVEVANRILDISGDGVIRNWYEIQEMLVKELEKKQTEYNKKQLELRNYADDSETGKALAIAAENELARTEAEVTAMQDFINQLEESISVLHEQAEAYQDLIDQMQELNLERLTYELEQREKLQDKYTSMIELSISRLEDNYRKIPEIMRLYFQPWNSNKLNGTQTNSLYGLIRDMTFGNFGENGSIWKADDPLRKLWALATSEKNTGIEVLAEAAKIISDPHALLNVESILDSQNKDDKTAGISAVQYMEVLDDLFSKYGDAAEQLIDLQKQMPKYYKDALDGFLDDIEKIMSRMDHNRETIEHYSNLMGLIGSNYNNSYMNRIIQNGDVKAVAVADPSKIFKQNMDLLYKTNDQMLTHAIDAKKEEFAALKAELADWDAKYKDLVSRGMLDEADIVKRNMIEPLEEQIMDVENNVFELLEERLDKAKEHTESNIKYIFDELEDTLTTMTGSNASMGWDALSQAMGLATDRAEEFLTPYQKAYELSSMMRTVQADMDKTDNQAAKTKLQNFTERIKRMEREGELSRAELEIEKARYEQLLAQIALEEAQNAKSTVRLQRDSEGNYGYVYTADKDAIDDATQKLDDTRANIYEITKKYYEESVQLTAQLAQEYQEANQQLLEMRLNDEISEAEYWERKDKLASLYNQRILDQREKFFLTQGILHNEFSEAENDIWAKDFAFLVDSTNTVDARIGEFVTTAENEITELDKIRQQVFDDTEFGLKDLQSNVQSLEQKDADLATEIKQDLIPAMRNLLGDIKNQTAAWLEEYKAIETVIDAYQAYQQAITNYNEGMLLDYSGDTDYDKVLTNLLRSNGYNLDDPEVQKLLLERKGWATQNNKQSNDDFLNDVLMNTDWSAMLGKYAFRLPGITNAANADSALIDRFVETRGKKLEAQGKTDDNSRETVVNAALKSAWGNNWSAIDSISVGSNGKPATGLTVKEEAKQDVAKQAKNPGDYSQSLLDFFTWAAREGVKAWDEKMILAFSEINPHLAAKIALRNEKITNSESEDILKYMNTREFKDLLQQLGYYSANLDQDMGDISEALTFFIREINDYGGHVVDERALTEYPILDYLWGKRKLKISKSNDPKVKQYAEESFSDWLKEPGVKDKLIKKYDTGGFTGAWGPEGKFALLHEKELVLNKKDTENILDAVAMIRELSNAIDLRALSYAVGGGILSPSIGNNSQTIEQQVTIQASFPNATDHNEIEQAFTTLINRATQYAGVPID